MILTNIEQIYLRFIPTNIMDIIDKISNVQWRKRNKKENGINYIFETILRSYRTTFWRFIENSYTLSNN